MKSRFKSNNFIAIIIALILFAIGFLLYFIHKQSESDRTQGRVKTAVAGKTEVLPASDDWLVHIHLTEATRTRIRPDLT